VPQSDGVAIDEKRDPFDRVFLAEPAWKQYSGVRRSRLEQSSVEDFRLFPTTTIQTTGWSPADLHRRYQPDDVPFLVDDADYLGPVLEEDILSVTSHAIEGGKYVVSGPLLKAIYRHRIQLLVTDSIATDSRCVRTGIGTPSNVSLGKQNDERSGLRVVQPCRAGDSPIVARSPRRLPQFATELTRSLASDNGGSLSVQERECICPLARPEDPLTSISPSNTDPFIEKISPMEPACILIR